MKRKELARSSIQQVICIFVLLLFVFLTIASTDQETHKNSAASSEISEGWIDENGQAVDLYDLAAGSHSVTLDISELDTDGKAICFKTIDTTFKAYASDELIYDYNPELPKKLGISYGMQYHNIAIPEGTSSLRLDLKPVFANTAAGIRDIAIDDEGQYMTNVFKRNLFSFGQGTITIVIGLLFVIAGVTGQIVMKSTGLDFVSFGITCVIVGFVGYNDTLLLQVMTGRPELIRVVEYMCLVFLPLPALSFFASTTGDSHSKLLTGMFAVCLSNFCLQVWLTQSGISDYYYLVYISQLIIIITFVLASVIVVRAIRLGRIKQTLLRSVVWGLCACVLGAVIDLIRYYFFHSYGDLTFTRMGVLVYFFIRSISQCINNCFNILFITNLIFFFIKSI